MSALLHDLALVHHIDAVGLANGGEAVGDRDRRPSLDNHRQRLLDGRLGSLFIADVALFSAKIGGSLSRARMTYQALYKFQGGYEDAKPLFLKSWSSCPRRNHSAAASLAKTLSTQGIQVDRAV